MSTKNLICVLALALSTPLLQSAHASEIENCAQLWAAGFPISKYSTSYPCVKYADIEGASGTTKIYYSADLDTGAGPNPELVPTLEGIRSAAAASIATYSKYGSIFPAAVIYTGLKNSKGRPAETVFLHANYPEPVPMIVFMDLLSDSPDYQKQTIAHEFFHVYQVAHYEKAGALESSLWWREGSADFFSNLVYPSVNREQINAEAYDSDLALHAQDQTYSTTAFFQSFANQWSGVDGILTFLSAMPASDGAPASAQWQAVASYPSIDLIFSAFAKQFADTRVLDTGGGALPTHFVYPLPVRVDASGIIETRAAPAFTVQVRKYALEPGMRATFDASWPGMSKLSAYFRRQGKGTEWNDLYESYPVVVDLSCHAKPVELDVMLVSTAGPTDAEQKADLRIQAAKTECPCKPIAALPYGLNGQWVLDADSMKAFLTEALGVGGTIDSVTGEMLLTITPERSFRFDLNRAVVRAHQDDGIQIQVEANGTGTLATVNAGLGNLCLVDASADAIATTTVWIGGQASTSETRITELFDEGGTLRYDLHLSTEEDPRPDSLTIYRPVAGSDTEVPLKLRRASP